MLSFFGWILLKHFTLSILRLQTLLQTSTARSLHVNYIMNARVYIIFKRALLKHLFHLFQRICSKSLITET